MLALLAAGPLVTGPAAHAQGVIRDAEIEHTLRAIATPLLQAAGVAPNDVRIIMLQDRTLNAFVARGQNIFFHTGLLIRAESSSEIAGVMAHEIGHIAGGHLARLPEQLDNMATQTFLALILGAAAGALTGDPGVGAGVFGGASNAALRSTLSYTRTQESAADQAGMRYLASVGWSAEGFMRFMETLSRQEALLVTSQDPYMRTHPVTSERVATIRAFVDRERPGLTLPPALQEGMARARAKLIGYFEGRAAVGRYYPSFDTSAPARYARAYSAYRAGDLVEARRLAEGLAAQAPQDAYFQEFLGDIALSGGRSRDAVGHFERAAALDPQAALIRFSLGRAQLQIGTRQAYERAIQALRVGLNMETQNPRAWLDFSIALGRTGQIGQADLAHANYAALIGNHQLALEKAEAAQRNLPMGDPARLRAGDLIAASRAELRR